ncbi:hypothetical protein XPA_010410 [Xanthoria parietina]
METWSNIPDESSLLDERLGSSQVRNLYNSNVSCKRRVQRAEGLHKQPKAEYWRLERNGTFSVYLKESDSKADSHLLLLLIPGREERADWYLWKACNKPIFHSSAKASISFQIFFGGSQKHSWLFCHRREFLRSKVHKPST